MSFSRYFYPAFVAVAFCFLCACNGSSNHNSAGEPEYIAAKVNAADLSNQRVTAFAEDAQGFMWIGTFRGLNSFNSHKFHQYFCTDREGDLPDNQINSLLTDSKQRLWVATIWGIAYHNERDKFTYVPFDDAKVYCKQVFEGIDGTIFAISNNKLALLDEDKMCFNTVNTNESVDYAFGLVDFSSRIWVCDNMGTIKILDNKTFACETEISLGAPVTCYYHDKEINRLFVGTAMGLKMVEIATKHILPLPERLNNEQLISEGYISVIHKYNGELFVGTSKGLYCYNHNIGALKHQNDNTFPFETPDFVNTLYTDSHNNLWIGSYDHGFTIVSSKERFNSNHFLATYMLNKSVYSLATDKEDRIWMATLRGPLYLYDHKNGSVKQVALSSRQIEITSVLADQNGDIWLASLMQGGVYQCRYDGSQLKEISSHNIAAPLTLSLDAKGNIWVGSANGNISCIESATGNTTTLSVPNESSFVSGIVALPDGKVWATALNHPVYSVDITKHRLEETSLNQQRWNTSLRRSVFIPTDICYDTFDNLWIGTVGNGLLKYDFKTDSLTRMTGLPCTDIASILEDKQGNIWVSTQYGIANYDHTAKTFKSYFTADGIGGNQFYDRAACILADGSLAFGGTHGITIFNPIDLRKPYDVPLTFDELTIHNRPVCAAEQPGVIKKSLRFAPQVTLDHTQNGFCISFASLNYGCKEHDNYTYKMEGHDKYWIEAGHNNEAYYSNLRPGKYTFRVKVETAEGDNQGTEIQLPITIKPEPWLSWWAIMIYLAIAFVIARALFKARRDYTEEREQRRQAERDREQERKLNTINMSFFSNISHEFRTPLTMISGPVAQLQNSGNINGQERRLLDVVQRNVARMLRLVNQMMDFNKLENDTLSLQVEHVDALIYLRHTVETFAVNADEKGIALHTKGMEDSFVTWIDTDKLEKIMNNLLANAMKVTPSGSGHIDVTFDVIDADEAQGIASAANQTLPKQLPCIKIVVADNGPGLPSSELDRIFDRYYQLHNQKAGITSGGTGIGLYYSRALAKLHHGCLFAQNREDATEHTGAVFTLLLPVGEEAYTDSERVTATQHFATQPAPQMSETGTNTVDNQASEISDDKDTLLVVDDDPDVISYLKTLLSPHYNLLTSFSADEAFQLATDNHPDLILSDVIMPVTDGYDLCRRIKNDLQICHIPVILVTAKAALESQVEGLNTGADAYVTKPFDPKYLLALIKSQLSNRQKTRNILSEATETTGIEPDVRSGPDKAFMDELYKLMEEELSNSELDITLISSQLHISRTKLFYKIKGLTGSTPAAFFKTYKLNRAAELIVQGEHTMSEIAFMTGFSTQAHFSTSFKKQFGVSPTAYTGLQQKQ